MDKEDLVKLGLSKTEAALYLTLLKIGASDVQGLLQETGFYKANTYQALERLCDKGIISKVMEGKRRVYQIQDASSLVEFIERKKEELDKQKELAQQLSKEVALSKKRISLKETAAVFNGVAGVKKIYADIIEHKLDYHVFGSPLQSETIIPSYYWQNVHMKQHESGIKAQMIFHKSLRHWKKIIRHKEIKVRFFDVEFEPLTETTIYGNKIAFVVWTDKPIVTIIDNEHVADAYRQIFKTLWKSS
ncbi:MAG: helix-turn-helix domain-containing protein, partial [Candidatus Woesearchaeota archaeon]|nr:helix-turn-helix domain-containing protein [Candidatus Woesearchaeota archaeon]